MKKSDTIAAIATAAGGGIGIIRISGEKALEIAEKIFIADSGRFEGRPFHGKIIDPSDGSFVDEVLVSFMRVPKSYTKEDVVEINCHGGTAAVTSVLRIVLASGARIAEPGEFTKRAFLNGRIDLSQAEAVADIISAKTNAQLKVAASQLDGGLSRVINEFKGIIMDCLARIEAAIDYPEHEEEFGPTASNDIAEAISVILDRSQALLDSARSGKIIREGINAVIAGKPNVGKSSLLNALLKEERAIVTEIPGTTRDTLTEYINLSGILLKITDTAGIRKTGDIVEKIGVERSEKAIELAELVLLIFDGTESLDDRDFELLKKTKGKNTIILLNKADKSCGINREELMCFAKPIVSVSAKTGEGMDLFAEEIKKIFFSGELIIDGGENMLLSNERHIRALEEAREHLKEAKKTADCGFPTDLISIDLTEAYERLSEITGGNVSDDLVDRIFSEFCLGK